MHEGCSQASADLCASCSKQGAQLKSRRQASQEACAPCAHPHQSSRRQSLPCSAAGDQAYDVLDMAGWDPTGLLAGATARQHSKQRADALSHTWLCGAVQRLWRSSWATRPMTSSTWLAGVPRGCCLCGTA